MAGAVRVPNFFLAGVPKAGTSSLYAYLQQHPHVYMCWPKEPTFFGGADLLPDAYRDRLVRGSLRDRDGVQRHWRGLRVPGKRWLIAEWEDYLELFHDVRGEVAIGDASVDYFWLPSAAQAIHARVPDARLVFMLRDPAERLFSEYLASLWRHPPFQSFRAQFLEAADRADPWQGLKVHVGRYTAHLLRFWELFPRDQIRIHLYDDYRSNARAVLRDIFEFLGIDPDQPVDLSRRDNEPIVPRFPRLHALRRRIFGDTALTTWLPEAGRRPLGRLYRRSRQAVSMDSADRAIVVDYYRREIQRTAELIGRDLSAWLR